MNREEQIKKTWKPYLADWIRKTGFARAELYNETDPWEWGITDAFEVVTFVGERQCWYDGDTGITTRWHDVTCEGIHVAKVYY